ncbi:hypothetical protein K488DRAFT_46227 [Vararia minispora EC-137]|uniref:Uncharacterized protein n=1 Tax=Vararia minispora EC-137 TaxID=1314806 RepID=A0ACB8QQG4_9AGAM|nr:hypothetical protein K488DRAFT_46227 [Vararia minispora EC-137]
MSLWKIPFLLSGAVGTWLALTPPNPPPSKAECTKREGTEKTFGFVVVWHAFIWKVCLLLLVLSSLYINCLGRWLSFLASSGLAPYRARVSAESPIASAIFLFGWLTTLASGILRDSCYKTLGRMFTYEITLREGHQLVTSGPYNYVRHPSYSGVVLGVVGTLLMNFGPGTWYWTSGIICTLPGTTYTLLWTVMESYVLYGILSRALIEDDLLKVTFGKEWEDWAARVPYRVIPGVF